MTWTRTAAYQRAYMARYRAANRQRAPRRDGEKRCPGCGEMLPRTEYGVRRCTPDGRNTRCRPCAERDRQRWPKERL